MSPKHKAEKSQNILIVQPNFNYCIMPFFIHNVEEYIYPNSHVKLNTIQADYVIVLVSQTS